MQGFLVVSTPEPLLSSSLRLPAGDGGVSESVVDRWVLLGELPQKIARHRTGQTGHCPCSGSSASVGGLGRVCPAAWIGALDGVAFWTSLTASDPGLLPSNVGPGLQRSFPGGCRLDREIPKDGGVRILSKSIFWEDGYGNPVILTAEGLSSNTVRHRGMGTPPMGTILRFAS